MKQIHRSRLMRMSWEIQKRKHHTRSKALTAAWAIYLNEDITVYYLLQRHSHTRYPNKSAAAHITLFSQS